MASVDTPEENREFAEKNAATFPILSDPQRQMTSAYGVSSTSGRASRWTFYIDPQGIIRKIDKSVEPRTAGATLVSNLKALNVPEAD